MSKKFEIDFFELCFLVEACIPEVPIERAMFFESVSEKYYHQMTKNERAKLFSWIQLNNRFNLDNEDCRHFFARFNPNNQYLVYTEYEGKKETIEAYRFDDQYHTTKSRYIVEDHIYKVERIV